MLNNEENEYRIASLNYAISWYGDDDNATLLRKKLMGGCEKFQTLDIFISTLKSLLLSKSPIYNNYIVI